MTVTICDLTIEVDVKITPGHPGTGPTYDCGGTPPEPAEVEYQGAWVVDAKGTRLAEFDINEYLSLVDAKEAARIDDEVLIKAHDDAEANMPDDRGDD